jgi:hypothetical protein
MVLPVAAKVSFDFVSFGDRARVKFALMWANHDLGEDSPGAIGREVFDTLTDHS